MMNRSMFRSVLVFMAILSGFYFAPEAKCAQGQAAKKDSDIIMRVAILDDVKSIRLILKSRYRIYDTLSGKLVMEGPYLNTVVSPEADGIRLNNKQMPLAGIKVKVLRDANIYVEGKRFRGDMDIMKKPNGNLIAVNYIPLEEYLYGVLYHEVSHRWPMEALKTQAIAARTFAVYQARQNKIQPYDLRNDIYSQVYGGRTSEKWSTTRAVDSTKGQILTYSGEIFPAYYHATCAGHTEDASNLWNVDIPPLKGVVCNYCVYSPHYRWKKEIPLWELTTILKDNGYSLDRIASIDILSKNKSGRTDKVEVKDESNKSVVLTGKDFRQIIGPNEVKSTRFDISIKWGKVIISGTGWGHGVGMCQWGAYGMAKRGKKADETLKYYYPGVEITSIDSLRPAE